MMDVSLVQLEQHCSRIDKKLSRIAVRLSHQMVFESTSASTLRNGLHHYTMSWFTLVLRAILQLS